MNAALRHRAGQLAGAAQPLPFTRRLSGSFNHDVADGPGCYFYLFGG